MAFWGVEVKPGKQVTHPFQTARGRLRISQATLGFGSSTQKIIVQCNIGVKAPVLLCALLPGKTESCQLDLEFEETEDVVFSVLGPQSVYLTGYYVDNRSRQLAQSDDTESYGEDIEHTDGEESNRSDEDAYDGSFIDDSDPKATPPFPLSCEVKEILGSTKSAKQTKGNRRRLKKNYESTDSDNSMSEQNVVKGSKRALESEDDDSDEFFLSSSLRKKSSDAKVIMEGATEKAEEAKERVINKLNNDVNHVMKSKGKTSAAVAEVDTEMTLSMKKSDKCLKDDKIPPIQAVEDSIAEEIPSSHEIKLDDKDMNLLTHEKAKKKKKKCSKKDRNLASNNVGNIQTTETFCQYQLQKLPNCIHEENGPPSGDQNKKLAADKKHHLSNDHHFVPSSTEAIKKERKKAKKRRTRDTEENQNS